MFDSTTSVVRFLSDNVDNCVQEFMDEWAKVSKVVIIAREGECQAPRLSHPQVPAAF